VSDALQSNFQKVQPLENCRLPTDWELKYPFLRHGDSHQRFFDGVVPCMYRGLWNATGETGRRLFFDGVNDGVDPEPDFRRNAIV
jgi:hypothetical protein